MPENVDRTTTRTRELYEYDRHNGDRQLHAKVTTSVTSTYSGRAGVRWKIGPVVDIHPQHIPDDQTDAQPAHREHHEGKVDVEMLLQDNQQVALSVTTEDAAGNPSTDTGSLVFSVDDSSILTLTDNGDGTATVAATGKVGTAVVTVSDQEAANADGSAGADFLGSLSINVVGGPTTQIVIVAGTPTTIGG